MHKGDENLIPYVKGDNKGKAEAGRKGGYASGVAKREKKKMREIFEYLLEKGAKTADGEIISTKEAICYAQIVKASKGDTKAFEVIRDTVGEKPADKVEIRPTEGLVSNIDKIKEWQNELNESDK